MQRVLHCATIVVAAGGAEEEGPPRRPQHARPNAEPSSAHARAAASLLLAAAAVVQRRVVPAPHCNALPRGRDVGHNHHIGVDGGAGGHAPQAPGTRAGAVFKCLHLERTWTCKLLSRLRCCSVHDCLRERLRWFAHGKCAPTPRSRSTFKTRSRLSFRATRALTTRRGGATLVHWWRSLGCSSAAPHPDPPLLASPRVSAQVTGAMYSFVAPTPANGDPVLVAASSDVAELLDLDPAEFNTTEFVRVFAGAAPFGRPWAMVYGGHQFGSWAGQLVRAELLCRVFSAV